MHLSLAVANALLVGAALLPAQHNEAAERSPTVTPAEMGFEAHELATEVDPVQFFVSTAGRPLDRTERLPLVVFLQGSGPAPLFYGKPGKVSSSLMFKARDFPGFHYAVLAKPGVPFHALPSTVDSEQYHRRTSLDARAESAAAVVEHLVKEPWIDPAKVVLVGHSEGADVAPWAATRSSSVTHVVALCAGGISQMLELTLLERGKAARGEQTQAETQAAIDDQRLALAAIFREPNSWRKKWRGHSYLRWSTFMRPPIEAYRELDVPIMAISGLHDRSTPCESGEALELEFIRLGKAHLTFEIWPVDHDFSEVVNGSREDRRPRAIGRILKWLSRPAERTPSRPDDRRE